MKYFIAVLATILTLSACASSYDPKTGTYAKDNPPVSPNLGNDPISGVIAGVVGLIQLSSYTSGQVKPVGIFGRCTEQFLATDEKTKAVSVQSRPCEKTYLNIVNVKTGKTVKVWIDEGGIFSFNTPKGHAYSLQAFKELENSKLRTSDILTITTPREVRVSISEKH